MGTGEPHDHAHGTALARSGGAARRPLALALALSLVTFVVQLLVGFATGSLALLADSAHVLTDAVGIALALGAVVLATRSRRPERTFGLFRLEVLSALANAVLLLGVAMWAAYEAVGRIEDPPDVPGWPVLVVGAVGLATNVVALRLLSDGGSLAAEGARLEVLADAVGSVGVVAGGAIIVVTGATVVDAWIGLAIAVSIVPRSIRLAAGALRVLVQAAPPEVDLAAVTSGLRAIPDVVGVHDLHVWTLTSDMEVLSAHVVVTDAADHSAVLDRARVVLADGHGIHHATLQVEPEGHTGCDELDW
ncbi:cation diffusion facilitator family transporter [Dermatobacter hominis]|uniref:cation diffusion facilitator family transporter n=1 Tax=Dermatobacter hominis TaxID=2884263 RepID=UPI001D12BD18|nr:cation diffusion facilitator family transporter [Dermatobacter hominis]UDY37765.1 cation diffusion facilitator family transporter [Dermatobacter hominis]